MFELAQQANSIQNLQTQIKAKDDDIDRYINQRGKWLDSSKRETYDFATFGIYSPLLDNKMVSVATFEYLKNIITSRTIDLEPYKEHPVKIVVWELTSDYGNLPRLSLIDPIFPASTSKIPVFDGYENYGVKPRLVPIDINEQTEKIVYIPTGTAQINLNKTYTTKRNKKMLYLTHYSIKNTDGVSYEHYSMFSPSGKPIYIIIYVGLKDGFTVTADDLRDTEMIAREIADTVDIKPYN